MKTQHSLNPYLAVCLATLVVNVSGAEELATADSWALKLTPQVSYTGYGGSKLRSDMTSTGAYFDAQYLDRGGIVGGATYTRLNFKDGIPALNQAAEFLSGRLNFTPELLPGRLTVRLDGHQINNDDSTNESNDVQVLAPQLSFLNNAKSLYLDLGYAISSYGKSNYSNGNLTVQQWTPTLGFSFNQNYDWLQLRLYDVSASNPARALLGQHTDAVETKLTHYLSPRSIFIPYSVTVGGLAGNRMYAVDGDTALVYNLADAQKGSGFLAVQWNLLKQYKASLFGSYDIYETRELSGNRYTYSGATMYLDVTKKW